MITIIAKKLNSLNRYINKFEALYCAIAVYFLVISTTIGIVSRYIFGKPLAWPMEYGMFFFTYLAFIGASFVMRTDGHYKVGFVFEKMPLKAQAIIKIITSGLLLVFCVVIAYTAVSLYPVHIRRPLTLTITQFYYTIAVIVGFSFMTLTILQRLLREVLETISLFNKGDGTLLKRKETV